MLKKVLLYVINVIFPKTCLICNKIIVGGSLCVNDWNRLQFLQKPACDVCFNPFEYEVEENSLCGKCLQQRPSYFKAVSILKYDESSSKLITRFKYGDKTHISKDFARWMMLFAQDILQDIDFIAPVPLHKLRLMSRKYNQSALLAHDFSKLSNLPVITNLLIRVKNTKPQAGLTSKMRKKNISAAFCFNEKYSEIVKGKNVLLIDDVITTGSTIEACSKVLMKSGVGRVYVISVAKTILE